jgi:tetratricopeptide (TPR) repeat protein
MGWWLATLVWLGAWTGPEALRAALAHEQQGDSAAALQALEKLAEHEEQWELPRLEAARLRLKLDAGLDVAERHLEEARLIAPASARAWYLTGLVRLERGDVPGALAALEQAVRLREEYDEAREKLGGLAAQGGDWLKAEYHFRALSKRRPEWIPPRLELARALQMQGRTEDAEQELTRLLDEQPSSLLVRRRLADFYQRTGRPRQAEQVLKAGPAPARRRMRPLKPSRR